MGLIKKPSELAPKKAIAMLIYGQPGIGKTTLALSAPKPVLFDFDGGVNRINAAHQTPTLQVGLWEEVNAALQEVLADPDYETIVIDTLGKMTTYIERYIKENDLKENKGKAVWVKSDGTISLKGFGVRKNIYTKTIDAILASGRNVCLVAHAKEEKRNDDTIVMRVEAGSNSFAADIFKDLDLVCYAYATGNERHITFQSNDEHFCKKTGSIKNDYVVPCVVDEKGNPTGMNNFIAEQILGTYREDQEKQRDMHAKYDSLVEEQANTIAAIEDAEGANNFIAGIGKTPQVYDSLILARAAFSKRVKELGLVLDGKKYKDPQTGDDNAA